MSGNAAANRALDAIHEDGEGRNPLQGMFPKDRPVPSLETALAEVGKKYPHLDPTSGVTVRTARKKAKKMVDGGVDVVAKMSADEVASVIIYTMEGEPRDESLYFLMNKALRSLDRSGVRVWSDFIWLLLNAMRKIPPPTETRVYRGLKFGDDYRGKKPTLAVGREQTWAAFSSTATKADVMQTFLGMEGERVLYDIELIEPTARDVRAFSMYRTRLSNLRSLATTVPPCAFEGVSTED